MSNLFIGIITGLISGWIVAAYFRSKEHEEQWIKELFFDKQNLSAFAEQISLEIDYLRADIKSGKEATDIQANLLRILIKRPAFPSFDEKKLPEWSQEITLNYYELFNDMESYFKVGVIEERDLLEFRYRLNQARRDILLISTGENDLRKVDPFSINASD